MRRGILLSFIVIIFLAFILRFYQLGSNPPFLTWDEVAWGYNAYTLGLDGKDEFGRFLPYDYLESFGDFKPPMYAYLTVLPVKFFGLTEFATRFPSAFFGTLAVIVTFFLVRQLFLVSPRKDYYALGAAFLLAISPWHLMLSRAAFEANVASFIIMLGAFLFLKGVKEKNWLLPLSAVIFVLSMYTFNSARIVAPLLAGLLFITSYKVMLAHKKLAVITVLAGLLTLLPIVGFLLSPQASLRFKEVNIFSDSSIVVTANQQIANDGNAWWSKIIHNRRVGYAQSYIKHYLDNLTPDFLFIKGDPNPKFSTHDVGQLYLWELPFFIIGIILLFKKKEGKWWLVPLWIGIAIIPAGVARETPHALRIENSLPMFQLLTAYGVISSIFFLKNISGKKTFIPKVGVATVASVALFYFIYFLHGYFVHYPYEFSGEWQYGYKQSIEYVSKIADQYDGVYVTPELGRPYIYYLFYMKTDPEYFRNHSVVERDVYGFVTVKQVGNIHFSLKDVAEDKLKGKSLIVTNVHDVPPQAKILHQSKLVNGQVSLVTSTL